MQQIKHLDNRKTIAAIAILNFFIFIGCNSTVKDNINEGISAKEGVHAAFYNKRNSRISISTTKGRLILTDDKLNIIKISEGHKGHANSSFFSLDDNYIITGGEDRTLKVWNAKTLSLEKEYYFNFNSWTSVHGFCTLGGCGAGGMVVFFNKVSQDTLVIQLEKEGAFHLYYIEPDSSIVVSSGHSGYEIDLLQGKVKHKYSGQKNWVYCIMPSNDKKKIVTSSKDSSVKMFDRFTEKCLYTSSKLDGAVYVTCFSNDDKTIAASTSNGSIYFMDTTLTHIKLKIKAFNTRINTIHYSADGKNIVAGSEEDGVKIFSTIDGKLLYELTHFE